LTKGLLDGESNYILNNVKIRNVRTNSKALFYFSNNNISIDKMDVDNVSLIGDRGDTSFLLYDSEDLNTTLSIKNMYISNCVSNGPFIKIKGISNQFIMEDSVITDVNSYGSIIENISKNVIIIFIINYFYFNIYILIFNLFIYKIIISLFHKKIIHYLSNL